MMRENPDHPLIWLLWHNRIFAVPYVSGKFVPLRSGAVLTSASKDGEIIARVMKRFRIEAVRGSSSRRGGVALKEMVERLGRGDDICITPDGPRGPKYVMQQGALGLAQSTGTKLFPVYVNYTKAWRLKSWDRFFIPKPFSIVNVTLGEFIEVEKTTTEEAFAAELKRVEGILREGIDQQELE